MFYVFVPECYGGSAAGILFVGQQSMKQMSVLLWFAAVVTTWLIPHVLTKLYN